jgi:long-chain fatty acid transport protein
MYRGIAACLFFLLSCFVAFPENSFAGGPVHGAKAAAMGTAFDAVADDPSAILFNPGGLTQTKGSAVYLGVAAVKPTTTYTSPSGESETTASQVFFPPHLYAASHLGADDLVFGIGLYSPFGIGGRKWSTTGLTRYVSTEEAIATYSVNPVVAWRISPQVSIAAGLDFMHADVTMKRMINQSAVGAGDASTKLDAQGHGWGYNLGLLLFPGQEISVGLIYRSRITIDYRGNLTLNGLSPLLLGVTEYTSPISATSHFPDIYGVGIAYRPNERLVVDADVELVRWSSFDRLDLDVHQEAPPFVTDSSVALNWKDSWQFKLGLEYRMTDRHFLRGGYAYIKSPVPEQTLEPGNPDADEHYFSIGTGYRLTRLWLDWFYSLGVYRNRSVQNSILSGEYKNTVQIAGVSMGYAF